MANREQKIVTAPVGFPQIRDWQRVANDRLSTTELYTPLNDRRAVRLFYSYAVPIAFSVTKGEVRTDFVWWTPEIGSEYRTKTLMRHLTAVREIYGPRDASEDIAWHDCGWSLSEFRAFYRTAVDGIEEELARWMNPPQQSRY